MVNSDQLNKDERFYIDEYNLRRITKNRRIFSYKIEEIEIGKIYRQLDDGSNQIVPLQETVVYKYLNGEPGSRDDYLKYCETHKTPYRSETYFKDLAKSLKLEPYDIKKGAVCINQYNIIAEGQHRCCILLYLYGPNYKIKVVKIYYLTRPRLSFLYNLLKVKLRFFI